MTSFIQKFGHTIQQSISFHNNVRLLVAGWWCGDPRPHLAPIDGFRVARSTDLPLIAALARITPAEAAQRLRGGHRLYLGWLNEQPVAYGWSATRRAFIGEIGRRFAIPTGERYLWDFATLPAWRGQGLYPRLLQAILEAERDEAARFWIAYLPENSASARGICKAGFRPTGAVISTFGQMHFQPGVDNARAAGGAALLRLPEQRSIARTLRLAWGSR